MAHSFLTPFEAFGRRTSRLGIVVVAAGVGVLATVAGAHAQAGRPEAVSTTSVTTALTLKEFVAQLRKENQSIASKRTAQEIAATGIPRARAAYDTVATVAATRSLSRQKSTYEEAVGRGQDTEEVPVYSRDGNDFTVGVSQLLPTGATIEAKTSLSQFISSVDQYNAATDPEDTRPPGARNNRGTVGLSLTQPLLKDFGPSVTNARIRVAEIESKGALASSLEVESNVVVEGILGYLDLIVAQQRVTAARERIRNGERLLSEAQALARQGRLAEADVWEVESALDRYRSAFSESEHARYERANKLATMVMRVNKEPAAQLRAMESLPATFSSIPSLESALQVAMDRREDLRRAKFDLEREGIQLAYAKNQRLPRLDLVATYGINGLEYSASRAMGYSRMEDYPNWTLGLQLTFPLENRQAKADFAAASLRQKDALLALKALEVGITNDVDTSLKLRQSALERWGWWQASAAREARHVTVEREKFRAGRSDIREVLLREERLINAQLAAIEQQASVVKAEALLQASQGVLLEQYGQ